MKMKMNLSPTFASAALCLALTTGAQAKSLLVSIEPQVTDYQVSQTAGTFAFPVKVTRLGAGVLKVQLTFDIAGLPAGSTMVATPNPLVFTGNVPEEKSATLSITVPTTAAAGAYKFTVTAINVITKESETTEGTLYVPQWVWPPEAPMMSINKGGAAPSGAPKICMTGTPGQMYVLQATFDLSNPSWTNISTNAADMSGVCIYIDEDAKLYPARFYRAQAF